MSMDASKLTDLMILEARANGKDKHSLEQDAFQSALRNAAPELYGEVKRLQALEAAQRWIPVGERLPERSEVTPWTSLDVLLATSSLLNPIQCGYYAFDDEEWREISDYVLEYEVTHWRPLPALPEPTA